MVVRVIWVYIMHVDKMTNTWIKYIIKLIHIVTVTFTSEKLHKLLKNIKIGTIGFACNAYRWLHRCLAAQTCQRVVEDGRVTPSLEYFFQPQEGVNEMRISSGEERERIKCARRGFMFIMFCHQLAGRVCLGFCRKRRRWLWVILAIFRARLPFLRSPNWIVLVQVHLLVAFVVQRDGNRKLHPSTNLSESKIDA